MDDKIIDEILGPQEKLYQELYQENSKNSSPGCEDEVVVKRSRLSAIAAGGRSQHYLARDLTTGDIDKLKCCEVVKLYATYEAKLGGEITKSLGSTVINLYANFVGKVAPPGFSVSKDDLTRDLEDDILISNALSSVACEMYYKFGYFLAPISAVLTTIRHIKRDPGVEPESSVT